MPRQLIRLGFTGTALTCHARCAKYKYGRMLPGIRFPPVYDRTCHAISGNDSSPLLYEEHMGSES
jgi:hypothetical protein